MSNTYWAICMVHTPPLTIGDNDHHSPEGALREARDHESHKDCDLMIGRWSGGLIEVGCPDDRYHRDIQWVQSSWLLVATLVSVADEGNNSLMIGEALGKLPPCFNRIRLRELSPFLVAEMIGGEIG